MVANTKILKSQKCRKALRNKENPVVSMTTGFFSYGARGGGLEHPMKQPKRLENQGFFKLP